MIGSTTAKSALRRIAFPVTSRPKEAWHPSAIPQKDMLPALEMGRRMDVLLPSTAADVQISDSCRGMGQIHEDFAVLFQLLAHMSGLTQ
jgi:3-hydroxyisobutyrate dehydrogenase-like beta-hydroxyacid dehydrogenase